MSTEFGVRTGIRLVLYLNCCVWSGLGGFHISIVVCDGVGGWNSCQVV